MWPRIPPQQQQRSVRVLLLLSGPLSSVCQAKTRKMTAFAHIHCSQNMVARAVHGEALPGSSLVCSPPLCGLVDLRVSPVPCANACRYGVGVAGTKAVFDAYYLNLHRFLMCCCAFAMMGTWKTSLQASKAALRRWQNFKLPP
jgi:hypothetical protein